MSKARCLLQYIYHQHILITSNFVTHQTKVHVTTHKILHTLQSVTHRNKAQINKTNYNRLMHSESICFLFVQKIFHELWGLIYDAVDSITLNSKTSLLLCYCKIGIDGIRGMCMVFTQRFTFNIYTLVHGCCKASLMDWTSSEICNSIKMAC